MPRSLLACWLRSFPRQAVLGAWGRLEGAWGGQLTLRSSQENARIPKWVLIHFAEVSFTHDKIHQMKSPDKCVPVRIQTTTVPQPSPPLPSLAVQGCGLWRAPRCHSLCPVVPLDTCEASGPLGAVRRSEALGVGDPGAQHSCVATAGAQVGCPPPSALHPMPWGLRRVHRCGKSGLKAPAASRGALGARMRTR